MMKLRKGEWAIILFNAIYILAYSIYYLSIKNYEFLWYVLVLVFFAVLIAGTLRKTNFDYLILWGLSLWGFLHMSGGGLIVNGNVLYALEVWKFFEIGDTYILKFDQFVHAFGFFVTTLVGWHMLKPYLNNKTNYKIIYPLLFFIATGAGALNELVEFFAVIIFPSTGVGGYYNTALDLVFNSIGSFLALFVVHFYYRKNEV